MDPFKYQPRRGTNLRAKFHIQRMDKISSAQEKRIQEEIDKLEHEYKMMMAMNQLKRIKQQKREKKLALN